MFNRIQVWIKNLCIIEEVSHMDCKTSRNNSPQCLNSPDSRLLSNVPQTNLNATIRYSQHPQVYSAPKPLPLLNHKTHIAFPTISFWKSVLSRIFLRGLPNAACTAWLYSRKMERAVMRKREIGADVHSGKSTVWYSMSSVRELIRGLFGIWYISMLKCM